MIEITMYTRQDCHLCEELKETLRTFEKDIPFKLNEVDIDHNANLIKKYGEQIPVLVVGPYTLKAPIDKSDLEITLRAAHQSAAQIADIEEGIASGRLQVDLPFGRADRFTLWLSRNWLSAFNLFTLIYLGLPFLAPVLLQSGLTAQASWIYRAYGVVCHQFAYRSWFLFGEQTYYPKEVAQLPVTSYEKAIGLDPYDLWGARGFEGSKEVGFKVALCQRDVAIYMGILTFGILFAFTKRRLFGLPWFVWILLGILPIGLDGFSQLISQPPLSFIPLRESTPLLRTVTGFLFGFITAWFGYPIAEQSMRESREYLEAKLRRNLIKNQAS